MSKRAFGKFERRPHNFYPTPPKAIPALVPFLAPHEIIYEPCAGAHHLVRALRAAGYAVPYYGELMNGQNALDITPDQLGLATVFVTNPPWSRDILHRLIVHLSDMLPTWLLIDSNWSHTVQAAEFADRCRRIVSIGRLKFIENSSHSGYDDCAWYLFTKPDATETLFTWRK